MPHLTKDNELLVSAIERWRDVAIEEIDDIGSWRTATDDPPDPIPDIVYDRLISGNGWSPPKNFYGDTSFLVRRITTNFQHLVPSPLQDIYEAVARWHMDRNARLIPDQTTLSLSLDRSVQMLQAVNGSIMDASRKMKKMSVNNRPTSDEAAEEGNSADKTSGTRAGRKKDERIAKRNLRIKKLYEQRKLNGQWAELAKVANADPEIQVLKLDYGVTRDIARNAVQHPKKRRK
jgi:hypothetical protein